MITIELDLAPEHAGRLFRSKPVSRLRSGRTRSGAIALTWYEGVETGSVLAEAGGVWRLERPVRRFGLPAGSSTIGEAASPALLDPALERTVPRVGFTGRRRMVMLAGPAEGEDLRLTVLDGSLRDIQREWPCCRVLIEGDDAAAARLALALAETLGVSVPAASLAEEAMARSRGEPAFPPTDAAMARDATVDEAIRIVIGHLAATLLHWAPAAARGETPVAVHQMRVTLRRLRSALLVFREPLGGSLDALQGPLHELASRLSAARDWDVFLHGTGVALERAMAGEARIALLIEDASRSREAAYVALRRHLASGRARRLLLHLALLPFLAPWRSEADPALLATPVRDLAPRILERRYKRLIGTADGLASLPAGALHDARKSGKKLRYALEFFASVLPRRDVRKFARRLSRAQDELGAINDAATGAGLLKVLTRGGRHEFASGAVLGWLNARAEAAREPLEETWAGLRRQPRFWRHRRAAES